MLSVLVLGEVVRQGRKKLKFRQVFFKAEYNLEIFGLFFKVHGAPRQMQPSVFPKALYGYATALCWKRLQRLFSGDSHLDVCGKKWPSAGSWQLKMCEVQQGLENRNLSQMGTCTDNLGYRFWLRTPEIFERTLHSMFLRAEWYPSVSETFHIISLGTEQEIQSENNYWLGLSR